jgi:two-component system response regulator NreC
MNIRILLAEAHTLMRESLRSLIDRQPGMEVVAEAENGRTALQLTCRLKPDVVVMDINMPDLKGIAAARRMISDSPGVKIVALSLYSDRQFVEKMFEAGASGYLLKDRAFEELVPAIRTVAGNRTYLSPGSDNTPRYSAGSLLIWRSCLFSGRKCR